MADSGVTLPGDEELLIGGVSLPAGRRISAAFGSGRPVAWATIEPVPRPGQVWQALSQVSAETGLVPFLLAGLDRTTKRPWDEGEFSDPVDVAPLVGMEAADLLADLWWGSATEETYPETDYYQPPGTEQDPPGQAGPSAGDIRSWAKAVGSSIATGPADMKFPLVQVMPSDWAVGSDGDDGDDGDDEMLAAMIAPFTCEFPGLAPASDQSLPGQEIERVLDSLPPARIGLAVASRPADVLPRIGWDGAVNRWQNALIIAAILRSWEQRFGARLLTVGFAEIQLLASRPPRTLAAAQLLAAEQFAFCNECAGHGLHDVASIASHILESPVWTFWWD
jgi:hypothetical protein